MNFKDLTPQQQDELCDELVKFAMSLGSKNSLLYLIEDFRAEKDNPLYSRDLKFSFTKGFVKWNKFIYKETINLLYETMRKDEKGVELKPKEQKRVDNMLKVLKPVSIKVRPKNLKEGEGFSLPIVEMKDDESSEISLIFKVLFFYNITFAKDVLSHKS